MDETESLSDKYLNSKPGRDKNTAGTYGGWKVCLQGETETIWQAGSEQLGL